MMESDNIAKQIINFLEKRKEEKFRFNIGCDLLTKLTEDVESDEYMTKEDKLAAMNAIREVNKLLWKYFYQRKEGK